MKATKSLDGEMRLTVTVKHRVDFRTLVDCALYKCRNEEDENMFPPKNRTQWIDAVRYALGHEGDTVWARVEEIRGEVRGRFIAAARKHFPEFPVWSKQDSCSPTIDDP